MARGRRRDKEPPVPVTYEISPEIESVMARVTRLYPDQFSWTRNFRLGGVIVRGSKAKEREGCVTLARFVKVPPLWHGLTEYDAIIRIEEWAWTRLAPSEQEALCVHELCHGSMSEKGQLRTLRHDLEEFGFVVRQYGAWQEHIAIFDRQLSLFEPGLGREGKLAEPQALPMTEAGDREAKAPAAGDPIVVEGEKYRLAAILADGTLSLKRAFGTPRIRILDAQPLSWDKRAGVWRPQAAA